MKKGDKVLLNKMVAPFRKGVIHTVLGKGRHNKTKYVIEFELDDGKTWEILGEDDDLQKL